MGSTDSSSKSSREGQLSPADIRFLSIGVLSAILFFIGERTDAYFITFFFKPLPIFCLIAWCQWKAEKPTLYLRLIQFGLFMGSLGTCRLSSLRDVYYCRFQSNNANLFRFVLLGVQETSFYASVTPMPSFTVFWRSSSDTCSMHSHSAMQARIEASCTNCATVCPTCCGASRFWHISTTTERLVHCLCPFACILRCLSSSAGLPRSMRLNAPPRLISTLSLASYGTNTRLSLEPSFSLPRT